MPDGCLESVCCSARRFSEESAQGPGSKLALAVSAVCCSVAAGTLLTGPVWSRCWLVVYQHAGASEERRGMQVMVLQGRQFCCSGTRGAAQQMVQHSGRAEWLPLAMYRDCLVHAVAAGFDNGIAVSYSQGQQVRVSALGVACATALPLWRSMPARQHCLRHATN